MKLIETFWVRYNSKNIISTIRVFKSYSFCLKFGEEDHSSILQTFVKLSYESGGYYFVSFVICHLV